MNFGKLSTPLPLLQTQFGQPQNLLRDVLASLPKDVVSAAAVRHPHFWGHDKLVHDSGKPLQQYCNLDERASFMLIRDPSRFQKVEANDGTINMETWGGRRRVSPADYAAAAARLQPDMAVAFHDEIPPDAGNNRTRACLDRCVKWLQQCIDSRKKALAAGQTSPPLLAFLPCVADAVGRSKTMDRILALLQAEATAGGADTPLAGADGSPVAGFVLGCLGLGESPEERVEAIRSVISRLPEGGVRLITGIGSPAEVLEAISLGIDVVDTDYPNLLTQFGYAAAFAYDMDRQVSASSGDAPDGGAAPSSAAAGADGAAGLSTAGLAPRPSFKRGTNPTAAGDDSADADGAGAAGSSSGFGGVAFDSVQRASAALSGDATKLNLRDKRFQDDERPLVPGCRCFACSGLQHSDRHPPATKDGRPPVFEGQMRAYVHHLLNTHEMLGNVLLSVHNTYHYGAFFAAVRQSIAAGRFDEYSAWFLKTNGLAAR